MRRREVVRAGGGLAFVGLGVGPTGNHVAAHDTPTGSPASPEGGPTATPADFGPLGSVEIPRAKEAVVGDDGTTVFVAVTDGFAVVDVSDPTTPNLVSENREVLSDADNGPLTGIFDVKVDSDRLAVTGPAHPGGQDVLKAVAVYDVSDPTAPDRVTTHETDFFNHNCFIRDGVVYLCGNGPPEISLVTVDAETGEELGRWSLLAENEAWGEVSPRNRLLHDVWVRNGVAYLAHWDAGTWLVDVSDPSDPSFVAKVRGRPPETLADLSAEEAGQEATEPPGNDHFVRAGMDDSLAIIGVESWDNSPEDDSTGWPGGLHLYDIEDPTAAREVATIEAPPTPDPTFSGVWTTSHNFDVGDDLLYTSWYRGGVRVYDISDPTDPQELARWRDAATTDFWIAQRATDEFFVASSRRDPSVEPPEDRPEAASLYTFPTPDRNTPDGGTNASVDGSQETEDGTGVGGVGFGVLAAIGGLGLGAWRYVRD